MLIGRKNGQIDLFNTLSESINQLFNVNDNEENESNSIDSICGVECLIKRFFLIFLFLIGQFNETFIF